jgi:two-component system response regulator DesR
MEAGATGFVVKDGPADQLAVSIRRAVAGERVIDTALAAAALSDGSNPLTPRERDVLHAASGGATIATIATSMFLSQGTVRNYLSSAIRKTGARNRLEAVPTAEQHGWL